MCLYHDVNCSSLKCKRKFGRLSHAFKFPIRLILSQAVVVDRTMYVSGQLGLDVSSGQLVEGGVQAQAKQVRQR